MTARNFFAASAAMITTTVLTACGGTPGAHQILAVPESVQRQAIMACQAEQGINLPQAVQALRLDNGQVSVFAANGPGLSLGQARAINQCAQAKLLSRQSTTPEPIYEDQTYTKYGTATKEAASGVSAGCVRGQGPMQAGSLICPGY
ncbi:hypothetical protein ABMC88_07480 [Sulfitobacter sp. HNIBRBA2951]|uniref:hypothetical protein n=1 Tax=Sulfitobacter aquimarinus TaxID=3158557 RepID=UPI0032DEE56C